MPHLHRPVYVGSGIGSIFKWIGKLLYPTMRKTIPLVQKAASSSVGKKAIKSVKKGALNAGINVMEDVIAGKNVKDSIKENISRESKNVGKSVAKYTTKALKRKLSQESLNMAPPKKKVKKSVKSIFD